jgi:hypothetical protein
MGRWAKLKTTILNNMSRLDPPFKNLLASLRQLVFYNYDLLDDYFKTSFRLAKETTTKIELKIQDWDNKNPNHEYSGFDIHEGNFLELINFESKTLQAGILILHSEVENNLKYVCNSVGQEKGKTLKPKDISGQGIIDKCKKYLEQEFNIDFSSKQEPWDKLSAYNRLRNIITHQDGQISLEQTKTFEQNGDVIKLSKIQNIKIDSDGFVHILNNEVIFDFLRISEQLLNDCCELLDNAEN